MVVDGINSMILFVIQMIKCQFKMQRKMKCLLVGLFALLSIAIDAQMPEGMITYNRKTDWASINAKLPYVSSEEADRRRLVSSGWENKGTDYELSFKDNTSIYQKKETDDNNGWRRSKLVLIRDYNKKTKKDLREDVGTEMLIEDDIEKTKWKILNEIKEVAGYLCMKAETTNAIKDQTIYAWFTDAIPFSGGPEGFGGLPGMILELDINDGDAVTYATNVDLKTPIEKLPIPKKMKGKKMDQAKYDGIIKKFIEESIEGRKNPYWRIRF